MFRRAVYPDDQLLVGYLPGDLYLPVITAPGHAACLAPFGGARYARVVSLGAFKLSPPRPVASGQLVRGPPWQVAADAQGVRGVDVDLWPTGHRFDRGHRIRVQVASAAVPRSDRNPGTGEPPATGVRLVPADQEV